MFGFFLTVLNTYDGEKDRHNKYTIGKLLNIRGCTKDKKVPLSPSR